MKKAPDFSGVFFMFALILILVMIAHAMISYFDIWFFLEYPKKALTIKYVATITNDATHKTIDPRLA